MSDASGGVSSEGPQLQIQSQYMRHITASSDFQSLDKIVSSSEPAANGPDAKAGPSDGHSSGSMPAVESMTQDPVDADTPGGSGSQHSSECLLLGAPPQLLCLDLSPDTLSEGQDRVKMSNDHGNLMAQHSHIDAADVLHGLANPTRAAAAKPDKELSECAVPVHSTLPDSYLEDASSNAQAAQRSPPSNLESPGMNSDDGMGAAPLLRNPAALSTSPASCKTSAVTADDNLPAGAASSGAAGEFARPSATDEMLAASIHAEAERRTTKSNWLQQHLLDSHVPHEAVTAFLWSAARHIVPQVLTLTLSCLHLLAVLLTKSCLHMQKHMFCCCC